LRAGTKRLQSRHPPHASEKEPKCLARRRFGRQRLRRLILGSIPFIVLIVLWWMNTYFGWLAPVFIPPLADVLEAVVFLQEDCPSWGAAFSMHTDCLMTNHVFSSVGRMIMAAAVGIPAGIAFGVLAGMNRTVSNFLEPIGIFANSISGMTCGEGLRRLTSSMRRTSAATG